MIRFEINNENLVLKDSTSINFVLENPFFDIEYVINSPYSFSFNVPNDQGGVNARLLQNTNRITKRRDNSRVVLTVNCWVYLENNRWMYGSLKSSFKNGEFECNFNQYDDVISEQLDVSLTETDTELDLTDDILYDEIRGRAEDDYDKVRDFIMYPVYSPDSLGPDIGYILPISDIDDTHQNTFFEHYCKYINYWFSDKYLYHDSGSAFVKEYCLQIADTWQLLVDWIFDYIFSPALFVPWFVDKMFTGWGIKLNSTFFDDAEIQKLTIWTNKVFVMRIVSLQSGSDHTIETYRNVISPWHLNDYLPDISRREFLIGLKKTFCLVYLWDRNKSSIEIITATEFLESNIESDWTEKTLKGYEGPADSSVIYTLKTNYSDDAYLSSMIRQLTALEILNELTAVANYASLPVASTVGKNSICLVIDEQRYYGITGFSEPIALPVFDGPGQTWVLITQNYIDLKINQGATEISNNADTLLRLFNVNDDVRTDIYGDYDPWDATVTYAIGSVVWYLDVRYESLSDENMGNLPTSLGENWQVFTGTEVFSQARWTIPQMSEGNDSHLNKVEDKSENLRLLFYRGLQPYNDYIDGHSGGESNVPVYPYATHTDLDPAGNVIGDYSLSWNGANGLYLKHWKPYLDLMASTKTVNRKIRLSAHDLLTFDWRSKVSITDPEAGGTVRFLVKKISVNISLKGIETADVELCTV